MKQLLLALLAVTMFAAPSFAQMSEVKARVDGLT